MDGILNRFKSCLVCDLWLKQVSKEDFAAVVLSSEKRGFKLLLQEIYYTFLP